MSTYTHSDFERIATAIGIAAKRVANLGTQFEAAALWFRLDKRRPRRTAPSKRREKLNQVAKSARRLLKGLDINDPDEAADGPGDPEIFEALVLTGERDANPVMEATRRIGRLAEIINGICEVLYHGIAARAFERSFQLADYVQVKGASLENGLLHVDLVREIPEAMKPRAVPITSSSKILETKPTKVAA